MKKIGFLGLGVMGLHMALNVDRKMDVEVVGFDVSEEQLRKYQAAGGTAAGSMEELYETYVPADTRAYLDSRCRPAAARPRPKRPARSSQAKSTAAPAANGQGQDGE